MLENISPFKKGFATWICIRIIESKSFKFYACHWNLDWNNSSDMSFEVIFSPVHAHERWKKIQAPYHASNLFTQNPKHSSSVIKNIKTKFKK